MYWIHHPTSPNIIPKNDDHEFKFDARTLKIVERGDAAKDEKHCQDYKKVLSFIKGIKSFGECLVILVWRWGVGEGKWEGKWEGSE